MSNDRIQRQFGESAAAYATSQVHAQGASLAMLLEMVRPQPEWQVLDVATGAGHTAHKLAPFVANVVASDITWPMLALARSLADEQGLVNVRTAAANAGRLPFRGQCFDLVTCRLAAHHFQEAGRFLAECGRVLRPGGCLALIDNVVGAGSRLRGKQAQRAQLAARYVNALEKLRDPSHHRDRSVVEWQDMLVAAGFVVEEEAALAMRLDFESWANRMRVAPLDKIRLKAMLLQAPAPAAEYLQVARRGDAVEFQLEEAILIARTAA